ncbi:MAG: nucleotide sugar dehydrogenase [Cephaloticoccus sp.]|nr:nucleotide sugar dehydrogenase [Cephaloticoccus sp.]MCF7760835.1 nucleotide sugar dehydrogenase [Cephaloticoccus sp.]
MNITVLGLWHLGCVTAACMARHHRVTGLDFDETVLAGLQTGRAPLHEPGLDDLIAGGLDRGTLGFSSDPALVSGADLLWVCYDTPVDVDDQSDSTWVLDRLRRVLPGLKADTVVLLSSQLPVGTTAALARAHPNLHFACSPENLRLGSAISAFTQPARIVVGAEEGPAREVLEKLLHPLGAPLSWMRPASAEMVKHALNSFLALSVAYINELATLSEQVGADALEVAAGLKSDPRIGPRAYLNPGGPFAGGTLARDVATLTSFGQRHAIPLSLIPAIKESNDRHRRWAFRKLQTALTGISQPIVAVLGLAYTPGTSTLRRSAAVELCRQLTGIGCVVRAYDPLIRTPDAEHTDIALTPTITEAVQGAHAMVICTAWSELSDLPWPDLLNNMTGSVVVDAGRSIEKAVSAIPGLTYIAVGHP